MRYLHVLLLLLAVAVGCAGKPATGPKPLSGLPLGARTEAHHPTHVSGPDKGTDVCPV